MRTRGVVATLALVLVGVGVGGCAGGESASSDTATTASAPSYLFSVTSSSARLEPGNGGAVRTVTLTMSDTDLHTVWFTDRPDRDSGVMTTSELADRWAPGSQFAVDPPNVALVLHAPTGGVDTVVATMRRPAFDPTTRTLTAELDVLSVEEATGLAGPVGRRHDGALLPAGVVEASAVSLFIDPEVGF